MDSQELSRWHVLQDLDYWKKRLEEKEAKKPSVQTLMNALFGKALRNGSVIWQPSKKQS